MTKDKSLDKSNKNTKSNTSKNIVNPHDKAFKKLFSTIDISKDIIEKNLSKEILEYIDMDTLDKIDNSFLDQELQESFSDIIYKVDIKGQEGYIAILLEHKSYPDKLAIFQIAKYIINLWTRTIEEGKKDLPLVIPILIYHGERQWNYVKDIKKLIPDYNKLPKDIQEMLPTIRHDFIDITNSDEDKIREYRPLARLVVRSFKYIFSSKDDLIKTFLISVDEAGDIESEEILIRIIEIILNYYAAFNKDISEKDIEDKIKELEGRGEKVMNILQKREEIGMKRGIERGIERGAKVIRKNIFKTLSRSLNMDIIDNNIKDRIKDINDLDILNELFDKAFEVGSMEEFQTILDKIKK